VRSMGVIPSPGDDARFSLMPAIFKAPASVNASNASTDSQ
jgi:hypothetical protein